MNKIHKASKVTINNATNFLQELQHYKLKAYLESTSCVKNNCKGQSTEYSRAISSQPSSDISEASDSTLESPSLKAFAFGKSNCEDLTEIPKEGILVAMEREVSTVLCETTN